MNGAKLVNGNTTKPTNGAIGKGNPNLCRRRVAQKAIIPTPSL
jgi:hypothetical protein